MPFKAVPWISTGGRPFWVVNEGEYRMMNTFDLTVDQSFFELTLNPWTVRNNMDAFTERYARRSGIESTNSGLKNRLGLEQVRVRGRGSVFRVIVHKVTGWNVLRAAAAEKTAAATALPTR